MTIARNEHTKKFGREMRFLIDEINDGADMMSFSLSKPLKVGHVYNWDDDDCGIFKFVLQESNSTEFDNFELGIADYYLHFPKEPTIESTPTQEEVEAKRQQNKERKVWL